MSEIDELRKKMEQITLEMIKLLKSRTEVAQKIGNIKSELGITVTDEGRETKLREKIISECKTLDLDESIATRFINFLLNESVNVQRKDSQTHLTIILKSKPISDFFDRISFLKIPFFSFISEILSNINIGGRGSFAFPGPKSLPFPHSINSS